MSPEQFKIGKKYPAKPSDIWATGCTLYYMVFGKLPFYSQKIPEIKHKIMTKELSFPKNHNQDPNLIDCIKRCLDKNYSTRIVSKELLLHPWLTEDGKFILRNNVLGLFTIDDSDI